MATRPWIFLSNTFEVQTRGSNKRMLSLAVKTSNHLAACRNDAVINGIYEDFAPVVRSFSQIYSDHLMAAGIREGETMSLQQLLLEDLQTEIRRWEGSVYPIYVEDSPAAVAIFPNKRTPFFHGTYQQRITSIHSLAQRLAGDPRLSVAYMQVSSFFNMVSAARDMQLQKKGQVKNLSALLEQQRVLVAEALWGIVLGRLMDRFRSNPSQIEMFFDFTLLRKKKAVESVL